MPYINKEDRKKYDTLIEELAVKIVDFNNVRNDADKSITSSAGVLNYCITQLICKVFDKLSFNKLKYWHVALICGILDNVKAEFYRRKASSYEDLKIKENGDVSVYEDLK